MPAYVVNIRTVLLCWLHVDLHHRYVWEQQLTRLSYIVSSSSVTDAFCATSISAVKVRIPVVVWFYIQRCLLYFVMERFRLYFQFMMCTMDEFQPDNVTSDMLLAYKLCWDMRSTDIHVSASIIYQFIWQVRQHTHSIQVWYIISSWSSCFQCLFVYMLGHVICAVTWWYAKDHHPSRPSMFPLSSTYFQFPYVLYNVNYVSAISRHH